MVRFRRQFGGACRRPARNRNEYTHSYSDCFASFDSFNSFSIDSFDFELASTEKSETYGFAAWHAPCLIPSGRSHESKFNSYSGDVNGDDADHLIRASQTGSW